MIFPRSAALLLARTYSEFEGEDVVERNSRGIINKIWRPDFYPHCKGEYEDIKFPAHATAIIGGPNWDTATETGTSAWRMEMASQVSGTLKIGYWESRNTTDEPDSAFTFVFEVGAWQTPPLAVFTFNSEDPPEDQDTYEARYIFIPAQLQVLI